MHRTKGFASFILGAVCIGVVLILAELTTSGLRREAAQLRSKIDEDQRHIEEGREALAEETFSAEITATADAYLNSFVVVPEAATRSTVIHDTLRTLARKHRITIAHLEEHPSYQQLEVSPGVNAVVTTHRGWTDGDFEQIAAWLSAVQTVHPGFRVVAFSIQPLVGEPASPRRVRLDFTINAGSLGGGGGGRGSDGGGSLGVYSLSEGGE